MLCARPHGHQCLEEQGSHLEDWNAHEANSVVWQQLDFDDGGLRECQGEAADIGAHRR